MSKHLDKIIDLMKAAREISESDHNSRAWAEVEDAWDMDRFIQQHGSLSRQQYVDALSGQVTNLDDWKAMKPLMESPHNTPAINEIAFKKLDRATAKTRFGELQDKFNKPDDSEGSLFGGRDYQENIAEQREKNNITYHNNKTNKKLKENFNVMLGSLAINNQRMDKAIKDGNKGIIKNPNFKKNHLYRMAEKHPQYLQDYMENEHFDEKMTEQFFGNEDSLKTNIDASHIRRLIQDNSQGYNRGAQVQNTPNTLNVNPRIIHTMLDHAYDKIDGSSVNVLLDHAEPTFKKQWTDKVLGLSEGEYEHSQPHEHDTTTDWDDSNWDNWSRTDFEPEYDRLGHILASGRHLDDEQAEHIKRHGSFEDKYALYHNKKVDPKHGAEMFQKWHDGDLSAGYDSEELTEKYKEDKGDVFSIDDLDESIVEEVRQEAWDNGAGSEAADEAYSLYDYANDNSEELAKEIGSDYDDIDEIHDDLRGGHDWEGENPEFHQHSGNPTYVALNKLNDAYEDGHITLEELKTTTGLGDWSKLELEPDSDGEVHLDEVLGKLNEEFNGPETIDYSDNENFTIDEHPDYEDRYDEAAMDWRKEVLEGRKNDSSKFWEIVEGAYLYEGHRESQAYMDAENQAVDEYVEDNVKDHMDELYDGTHQNPRFIPEHLHAHIPNFEELNANQKGKSLDGGQRRFLNEKIKDRDYEHHYGEDQHFYEMVKDHAEANNGKIDVGTMNKLYPAQKEKWKKVFNGKGKITHEEASQKLEELPKTQYETSYGKWDSSKMQNVNRQDQVIFRLDHSAESLKPLMEDPDLYDTFKNVQKVSKQSGHPTKDNSIAWARVDTSDPNHWMIDEVQSDFGKTVTRYLRNEGSEEKAGHIDKISAHHKNWREALINSVLKTAKKHGAAKVSTHSPESKSQHTGSSKIHSVYKDSYKKVPRSMGFQASKMEDLPLTESGKGSFKGRESIDPNQSKRDAQGAKHEEASDWHVGAINYLNWAKNNRESNGLEADDSAFDSIIQHHYDMKNSHQGHASSNGLDTSNYYEPESSGEGDVSGLGDGDLTLRDAVKESLSTGKGHQHEHDKLLNESFPEALPPKQQPNLGGNTFNINPKLLKKHMDYVLDLYEQFETLEKGEVKRAAKGALLALGLAHGAHYMDSDTQQSATKQFAQENAPAHARSVSSTETEYDPVKQGYDEAKKEASDIIYRNDKEHFLQKYSDGLSPHVYKQTIKSNPELSNKYNYVHGLSSNTFKEVTQKNNNLRDDVHGAHYDKLHGEFGGDHEKMLHAWKNGIKSTKSKFRGPATNELGQQPDKDIVDNSVQQAPETPNFTNRRRFR